MLLKDHKPDVVTEDRENNNSYLIIVEILPKINEYFHQTLWDSLEFLLPLEQMFISEKFYFLFSYLFKFISMLFQTVQVIMEV